MNDIKKAIRFTSTLLSSCLLAAIVGVWLDTQFHSTPFVMLLLMAYAIVGNFYMLWKGMSKDEGINDNE